MRHFVNTGNAQQRSEPELLARYTSAGLIATGSHYLLMVVLIHLNVMPLAATAAGSILGMFVAHQLNHRWTMQSNRSLWATLGPFFTVGLITVLVNFFCFAILESLSLSLITAQLCATAGAFLAGYAMNRYWTFVGGTA